MRLALLVTLLAACSINKRSDQFACETAQQCDRGQTCQDGFCVGGSPPTDSQEPDPDGQLPPDAFVCPAQCTSCNLNTMTCTVDCNVSPTTCGNPINCPTGFNCNILCTKNELCQNINCSQGQSCKLECKGINTCRNVVCGPGECDITCTGNQSCRAVNCESSCACDVTCTPNTTCLTVDCPELTNQPFACSGLNPGRCTSAPEGCDTCE